MNRFFSSLFVFYLLSISIKQSTSSNLNDICNPAVKIQDWPIDRITSNTKLDTKNENINFVLSNATSIEECAQQCCASDCNYVLFKEMQACYLILCKSNADCTPTPNHRKSQTDPVDYLINIRSADEPNSRQEKQILDFKCSVNASSVSDCPLNELCLMGNCVCPNELNYMRIDNECREYLKPSQGCSMFMNECNPDFNEECVTVNTIARHGTCQCKIGFKRNLETFVCENFEMKFPTQKMSNKRKRPDLKSKEETDETLNEILQELGVGKNDVLSSTQSSDGLNQQKPISAEYPTSSTTSSTLSSIPLMTSLSTTTTTEETTTEPIKINTKNLIAFAGNDIHVYYPSTTCVLDGSLTRYYGANGIEGIVKWQWVKHESSPAFGRFHQTNEKSTVVYENLVEGVYRFILKVWSVTNEFSQDTVHVYVHSYLNETINNKNILENELISNITNKYDGNQFINDNIIQIELDTDPKQFTEIVKNTFMSKLRILLQQSDLKNPHIILINTRISMKSKKSRVVLDILVCEDVKEKENKSDLFDFEYLSKISEDVNLSFDTQINAPFYRVLKHSELIKILKMNHRIYSFKSYDSIISVNKNSASDYLGLKITEIGLLTCGINKNSINFNCSNQGRCDSLTGKCICNKYWMPNLYRFYFQNEIDLTNGNNCEWNVPLFATFATLFTIMLLISAGTILRYAIFYFVYIFCCFCCCCRTKKKVNKYEDFKKNKMKKYSKHDLYLEEKLNEKETDEDDDEYTEEMQHKLLNYKRTALNKLKSKFRSVPALNRKSPHKYALLNDEDETRLIKKIKKGSEKYLKSNETDRMGAKLDLDELEARRDEDDDEEEDVLFEQNYSTPSEQTTNKKSNKKQAENYIKEYKQIV